MKNLFYIVAIFLIVCAFFIGRNTGSVTIIQDDTVERLADIKFEYEEQKLILLSEIAQRDKEISRLTLSNQQRENQISILNQQHNEKINSILNPDLSGVGESIAIIDSAIDRFINRTLSDGF